MDLTPQRRKERTLEALLRQLAGLTRQQHVLMIFEDLHWADPSSRELLDLTVEQIGRLPVLLVATFCPEFQPPWPAACHNCLSETPSSACHQTDEVKALRDKAAALEEYARQAKNADAARQCRDIRERAERRWGELYKPAPKAQGTRGNFSGKQPGTSRGRGAGRGSVAAAAWSRHGRPSHFAAAPATP